LGSRDRRVRHHRDHDGVARSGCARRAPAGHELHQRHLYGAARHRPSRHGPRRRSTRFARSGRGAASWLLSRSRWGLRIWRSWRSGGIGRPARDREHLCRYRRLGQSRSRGNCPSAVGDCRACSRYSTGFRPSLPVRCAATATPQYPLLLAVIGYWGVGFAGGLLLAFPAGYGPDRSLVGIGR